MGACETLNVEINILVYENEMFSLPAKFHFSKFHNSFNFLEKIRSGKKMLNQAKENHNKYKFDLNEIRAGRYKSVDIIDIIAGRYNSKQCYIKY